MGEKSLSVDAAEADATLGAVDVEAADLNGDGLVKGAAEMRALFGKLDHFDRDGNYGTMRLRDAGGLTRAGEVVEAAERLAESDMPPQSMSRDEFIGSMRGHTVGRFEAAEITGRSMRGVDSNGDGEIAGLGEVDRLFSAVDEADSNGDADSVRTARGRAMTPLGTQIEALMDARRTDTNNAWTPQVSGDVGSAYSDYQDAVDDGLRLSAGTRSKVSTAMDRVRFRWDLIDEVARRADVPPALVAGIWYREDSLMRTDRYLHNGQRLGRTTTMVPRGIYFERDQFVEAAAHALGMKRSTRDALNLSYESKDLAAMAAFTERYNGFGYRRGGRVSPYVAAGTDLYRSGLYVRDGAFDPRAVDRRLGTLPLMQAVLDEQD